MKRFSTRLSSLLSLLALTTCLTAQEQDHAAAVQLRAPASASNPGIPQFVRFSGVLRSPAGGPLTGTVVVRFAIYQQQSGGEPMWQETQQVNADDQGRYTVLLGATEPAGLPSPLFQGGEAHWLAVSAGQAREAPRTLLASVPYALKASDAETLGGKPLSAFILAGTTSGTGSDGLNYINPNASAPLRPAPNATSGTAGYIGKFTDATDLGNSAIFQSGNYIGIGTTIPNSMLTLGALGTATSVANYGSGVITSRYSFWNGTSAATNAWTMGLYANPGSNAGSLFQIAAGTTDPGPQAMRFFARQGGSFFFYSDTGSMEVVRSGAATASANLASPPLKMFGQFWTGAASASDSWIVRHVLGTGTTPASTLAFQHTGSPGNLAVTLPSNAKLGLGIGVPSSTLDVAGTGHFTGAVNFGSPVTFASAQTFPGAKVTGTVANATTAANLTGNITESQVTSLTSDLNGKLTSVSPLNAANLTGTVPAARLTGTYNINVSGNAATATSAAQATSSTNALALNGHAASYFATLGANTFGASQIINGNLTISGTGNGIMFPDGTSQTSAGGGGVPSGYMILSTNPVAPPGYSLSPLTLSTGSGNWETLPSMHTPTEYFAAARDLQGNLYAIGGYNGGDLNTAQKFNPSTKIWTTVASMPTPRYDVAGAANTLGDIYVVGGYHSGGLATVEKYSPSADSWTTTVASMPTARYSLAVVADAQGRIYAIGGSNGAVDLNTVERYDPSTNTWTTLASMPTARSDLAAAMDAQGNIYAIGGTTLSINALNTTEKYDPSANTWTTVASMPTARYSPGAVADAQGNIYVVGGYRAGAGVFNTVEKYNPSADTWSTLTSMPTARQGLSVVTDLQGRIYALAGDATGLNNELTTVERYSPAQTLYIFIKN